MKRETSATAPNRLWATDLTFVPTWAGVTYVCFISCLCFIVDTFSRIIVGWRCTSHTRTLTVLEAIETARWPRGPRHDDLRSHSETE